MQGVCLLPVVAAPHDLPIMPILHLKALTFWLIAGAYIRVVSLFQIHFKFSAGIGSGLHAVLFVHHRPGNINFVG